METKAEEQGGVAHRAIEFVKRRPLTTLALGAGVALLGGAEWAFAALVGGAAAALLSKESGAELRHDLRARLGHFVRRGRGSEPPGTPPPAEPELPR